MQYSAHNQVVVSLFLLVLPIVIGQKDDPGQARPAWLRMIAIKMIMMIMIMIIKQTRVNPFALKGCSTSGNCVAVQI